MTESIENMIKGLAGSSAGSNIVGSLMKVAQCWRGLIGPVWKLTTLPAPSGFPSWSWASRVTAIE